jgi:hypothetical protein
MPALTDAEVENELLRLDIHGNGTGDVAEKGRAGRGFGDDSSSDGDATAQGSPRATGDFAQELKADRAADQNPMLKS